MKPLSNKQRDEIGADLRATAAKIWSKSESGIYTIRMNGFDKKDIKDITSAEAAKDLKIIGLSELFFLTSTSKTKAFWFEASSHQQFVFTQRQIKTRFNERSQCPLVLDHFKEWRNPNDHKNISEVFPLVAMSETEPPEAQQDECYIPHGGYIKAIMEYMAKQSGFRYLGIFDIYRELALLPNGLPVIVDPDLVGDPLGQTSIEMAIATFKALQNELNLPEELNWLDSSNNRVQHKLFANPFVEIP